MTTTDDTISAAILTPRAQDDRPFLIPPGAAPLSYADVLGRAAQIAHALTAAGLTPGDRVAAQIEKSIDGLCLYFGTLMAGGAYLPLNTGYMPAELDYLIGDAEPRIVVCDPRAADVLGPIAAAKGATLKTLDAAGGGDLRDAARDQPTVFAPVAGAPDDLAAILYTSGTTGKPKGAMLSQRNLVSNARALAEWWRFTQADRLLHALPIYHTHGLFVAVNTLALVGGSILLLPKFAPDAVLAALPDATAMMGVPTFYTRLLDEPRFDRAAAAHMRVFISGSAPLLAETHVAFEERTGHRIIERYGMTETNMNVSNPYDGERRAGAVGFPLPGVEIRIVDPETGAPRPDGETGMVEVKGPNVFQGYWRNPEKTKADFRPDGFFITGDLGRIDADGYLAIVGRAKDLIITGGLNVYPKEIETAIDELDGVSESAVIGAPHPDFGEGVVAVVVKSDPGIDAPSILAGVADKLAKFKQPKQVVFVEALPRNAMGKVQKKDLRATYEDLFAA